MRLLLLGIAALCCTAVSPAQQATAPLPPFFHTPSDSVRAHALLALADSASVVSLDAALGFASEAMDLTRANIGTADHALMDSCLTFLGTLYVNSNRVQEGIALLDSAIAMNTRLYPSGHALRIDQYYSRAFAQEQSGDPATAAQGIRTAIALHESMPDADSAGYSYLYWYMGWLVFNRGDMAGAEPWFARSLEIKRKEVPPDSPELGQFLYQIGWIYQVAADRHRAGELFAEALNILRNDTTVELSVLLDCMQGAIAYEVTSGKFRKAAALYDEAEALFRSMPDRDEAAFADFLRKKGDFLASYGKYNEAERLLFEAYDASTTLGDAGMDGKLYSFMAIASYYNRRGMHAEAEPWFLDAIDFARTHKGETAIEYGIAVNNLGSFYLDRGRYKEALALFDKAYPVLDAAGPLMVKIAATTMNNMAIAQDCLGNTAEAESLYTATYERVLANNPADDPNRALAENNFGLFYLERGEYENAEPYLRRAVAIYRLAYSEEPHPHLATAINNKARLFAHIGLKDSADILFAEALALRRKMFGPHHPDLLKSLWHYGEFVSEQGWTEKAHVLFKELITGLTERMDESFSFESEGSQLDFVKNILHPGLNAFSRFCLKHGASDGRIPGDFLDALLKLKGAVANESARRGAELHKNKQALDLNTTLTALREQQAALASRQSSAEVAAERTALRRRADSADAALRKLDREYDKLLKQRNAGWTDVQRVLKPGEALIEFSAVPSTYTTPYTVHTPYLYGAVVLKNSGDPAIVNLCEESELRPFLATPVSPRNQDSYVVNPDRSVELYAILWKPLEEHLEGIKRVFLSVDGLLYRISFATLCRSAKPPEYLEDVLDIRYLAGGRQLLNRDPRYSVRVQQSSERFTLVGDPDFAAVFSERAQNTTGRIERGGWDPLPATEREITAIAALCTEANIPAAAITGPAAREDTIKAQSGAPPRVLHIATHGFFFPAVELEEQAEERMRSGRAGATQLRIIENPMLRSGLILAGANAVWSGEVPATGSNDGILTALEVSRLNLTGTELVTLSACETGLGDVRNGEGIFGLQRAFQVAGADCILMSLWRVADEPTSQLMQAFYTEWLSGKPKPVAFRAARDRIRAQYPSPYVWAAFVMVGE